MKNKQHIKKTKAKVTFMEFCHLVSGFRFYKDSEHNNVIHKFELFWFYNLKTPIEALDKFFTKRIKPWE
jgi:hypothetical protein